MHVTRKIHFAAALLLIGAAAAHADATSGSADASASASAETHADGRVQALEARAAKAPAKAVASADAKLEAGAKAVNAEAEKGEDQVATRLAGEFGMTAEAMTEEKSSFDCGWGELMVAHTLAANAGADVTVEQLFAMRKDGEGWGRIAAGLGFNLGQAVSAVKAEGRVANGLAKADGHVAVIHGPGARAGIDGGAGAATHGLAHGGVNAGVGASVGGPRIKVGH